MRIIRADCPYCATKSVAFMIVYEAIYDEFWFCWDTFAQCGHCRHGIIATFETRNNQKPSDGPYDPVDVAPPLPENCAPPYTPENVARFFEQGMDNQPKNWDPAGGMFRKALDTGLKSKFPKINGRLIDRIDKAAEQQKLTPESAKWAHQIRLVQPQSFAL